MFCITGSIITYVDLEEDKDLYKFPKVIIEDKTYTFIDPLSSLGFGKYIQHGFTCLNNAKLVLDNINLKLVVVSTVDITKNKEVYVNWNVPLIVLPEIEFPVILKPVSESGTNLIINTYGRVQYQYSDKVLIAWNNVICDISESIKENWYNEPEHITNEKLADVLKSINNHFFNGSLDVITPNIRISINNTISNDTLGITYGTTPDDINNVMEIEINTNIYCYYKKVEWLFDGVHINNNRELLIHTIAHEICHVIQNYYLHNDDYFTFSNKGLYGNHHDSIFANLSQNIFCHPMAATRSNLQRASNKFKRLSLAQIVSYENGDFHMYKRR